MSSAANTQRIPIVAIGTSAGGLRVIEAFLQADNFFRGAAIVIIQHLDPTHKSWLAEIVSKFTDMRVKQIEQGDLIEPDVIYIIPPNATLSLQNGAFLLMPREGKTALHLPIDTFFQSAALELQERLIGLVFSGTGTDGSLGIQAIKQGGGMTIVQDPNTADFNGMPLNAIQTGAVDFVLPPEEIPERIKLYLNKNFQLSSQILPAEQFQNHFDTILEIVFRKTGRDFKHYKHNTLHRRVNRRILATESKNVKEYIELLENHADEAIRLCEDMLINVTRFFRDHHSFEFLRKEVLPELVRESRDGLLRIWVQACSTGEEAYSLAMLTLDYIEELKTSVEVQVFASDIDRNAIEKARKGAYGTSIQADVPASLLKKYFVREPSGNFRVKSAVRERVIFAEHNVIQDPPYSRIDLISCRNFLIYLESELQQRVLMLSHFALNKRGFLMLGNAESIGNNNAPYFKAKSKEYKIFQKRAGKTPYRGRIWNLERGLSESAAFNQVSAKPIRGGGGYLKGIAEQMVLRNFTPPSLIVNGLGDIQYVQGNTGDFLEVVTGEMSNNLFKYAREGLKLPVSKLLRKATKEKSDQEARQIPLVRGQETYFVDILVKPIKNREFIDELFLVVFQYATRTPQVKGKTKEGNTRSSQIIKDLEQELNETRHYLQTTIEDLEIANEEAQSANEELQTTNEELQTSKEELQSVNEELLTTNNELQNKLHEVSSLNSMLNKLMSSTQIPTLFLDKELKVYRFTPSVQDLIPLTKKDVGRPLENFSHQLENISIVREAKRVIASGKHLEKEVNTKSGGVYWMRVAGFSTPFERASEGVVITFTDIFEKKKQEAVLLNYQEHLEELVEERARELRKNQEQLQNIATGFPGAILRFWLAPDHKRKELLYISDGAESIWRWASRSKLDDKQRIVFQSIEKEDRPIFNATIRERSVKPGRWECEWRITDQLKQKKWLLGRGVSKEEPSGGTLWDVVVLDITERKQAEEELKRKTQEVFENKAELEGVTNALDESTIVSITDIEGRILKANDAFCRISGYTREELIGKTHRIINSGHHPKSFWKNLWGTLLSGKRWQGEIKNRTKEGAYYWVDSVINPIYDTEGNIHRFLAIRTLITARKQAEKALKDTKTLLEQTSSVARVGGWSYEVEEEKVNWSETMYEILEADPALSLDMNVVYQLIHPDSQERHDFVFKRALETGQGYDEDLRMITRQGNELWGHIIAKTEVIDGKCVRIIGVLQDITERKQNEQELQLLKSVVTNATDAVLITEAEPFDEPGPRIVFVNEAFTRMTGYTAEEAIGQTPRILQGPESDKKVLKELRQRLESWQPSQVELINYKKDGTPFWVSFSVVPVADHKGYYTHWIAIERDITEQKEAELERKNRIADLVKINKEMDNFVYRVSHDLRAPLTSAIGTLRLTQKTQDPEERQYLLSLQEKSLEKLDKYIRDILDYSRNARMKPQVVELDVKKLIQESFSQLEYMHPPAVQNFIEVEAEVPYYGDETRLLIILNNLISNALRFYNPQCETPFVKVQGKVSPEWLELRIEDNGIGIFKEYQPKVFDMFYRASDQSSGSGLGLYIVKETVTQLKGNITFVSNEREGTVFTVRLPNEKARFEEQQAEES